jgi:hypothetical protein
VNLASLGARAVCAVAAVIIAACTPGGNVQKDNWSELCSRMDCEQFPVGYLTEQIGGEYFYFPISRTGMLDLREPPEPYVQRDERGRPTRAVRLGKREWLSLGPPCCEDWSERFGLTIPRGGYTDPGKIDFHANGDIPAPFQHRARHAEYLSFASADELGEMNFASFNDDFWLAHEGEELDPPTVHGGRELVLVSKRPLLFSRHVILVCRFSCDVETAKFPADPQSSLPAMRLGLTYTEMENCPRPGITCDHTAVFAGVPRTLRWIEQIFEGFRTRPQSTPAMPPS